MKKFLSKIVCLSALFVIALAPLAAKADSISGSLAIAGLDTFNSTSISFGNGPYSVLASTITGVSNGQGVTLPATILYSSLSAPNASVLLFSTTANGITTSFSINGLTKPVDYSSNPAAVNIFGFGTFSQTGKMNTTGNFSLSSTTSGMTSFQLNGTAAATPEPNSLMLLGSGLVSTAGMLMRRRRAMQA